MISSENISLKSPLASDVDFLLMLENNPKNWQYGGNKTTYERSEILAFVKEHQTIPTSTQQRFIIYKEELKVGCLDLFEYNSEEVGVGIIIAEDYRKLSIACMSINLIKEYCFKQLNVKTIFCNISPQNIPSINLFHKCGFTFKAEKMLYNEKVNYYECYD